MGPERIGGVHDMFWRDCAGCQVQLPTCQVSSLMRRDLGGPDRHKDMCSTGCRFAADSH